VASRRYHSLLIAALPAPLGRFVMLNHLSEWLRLPDGKVVEFGGEERAGGALTVHAAKCLKEFRLDLGLPVWRYQAEGFIWEKRVLMPHGQNTVHVGYRLLEGPGAVRIRLRPSVHFRPHESPVGGHNPGPYRVMAADRRLELCGRDAVPPLRLYLHGEKPTFTLDAREVPDVLYRVEESRGYDHLGGVPLPEILSS
jgi:Glycogen debranching enzyme N terminal